MKLTAKLFLVFRLTKTSTKGLGMFLHQIKTCFHWTIIQKKYLSNKLNSKVKGSANVQFDTLEYLFQALLISFSNCNIKCLKSELVWISDA